MERNDGDEARPTEYLEYHWYGTVITDDKGNPIARSGTGAPFKLDDAKPVNEEVDAIKKLKEDMQLAMKRRKEKERKKGGKRTRGKKRSTSRKKKRTRKRGKSMRKRKRTRSRK